MGQLFHSKKRISAPVAEVISLAEAKLYLRVDHADEDVLIAEQIVAVRMFAEDYLARSLVTQDWEVEVTSDDSCFALPMQPIQHITAVYLMDEDGAETELDTQYYRLSAQQEIIFESLPSQRMRITYRAGEDVLTFPMALKQAMLAHIALCYERRGDDLEQPLPAHRLYAPYQGVRI